MSTNTAQVAENEKEASEEIVASKVVFLNEGGDMICEYHGCSGDCDCHGDKD